MSENYSNSPEERLIYTRREKKQGSATKNTINQVRLPLFTAIALGVGLILGGQFFGGSGLKASLGSWNSLQTEESANDQSKKLRQVLSYIEDYYVDTVNLGEITDHAINEMLSKLDPHTSYIPARDVEIMNAQLEGDFEGIGVEFFIHQDTIQVVMPLPDGPSDKAGVLPGDRIIRVEEELIAGVGIDNRKVFDILRGKKDSEVKMTVFRPSEQKEIDLSVKRGVIPTSTVDIGYMLSPDLGYIKVSRFGANTYAEFKQYLESLIRAGAKSLVLDLRGNPGGYMSQAVKIADEFISGRGIIVYTDGKGTRFDSEDKAKKRGRFEKGSLIVLIDEGSASASEIVAGALQDHDRAWIVGRRSFGKGLVQKPISLRDNSELRLTISRYYIPSGRSIQKPYSDTTEYSLEIMERYTNGELYHTDSSKVDTLHEYKTLHGRTVYGGGGILPDYFVAQDTSYLTPLLDSIYQKNIIRAWATQYFNSRKEELLTTSAQDFVAQFDIDSKMEESILDLIKKEGIKINPLEYELSKPFIFNRIKAHIGKLGWQNEAFYPVFHLLDRELLEAKQQRQKAQDLEIYYLEE